MKIVICASIDFTHEINEMRKKLGHQVVIPKTSQMIIQNKINLKHILKEKKTGKFVARVIKQNSIRDYFKKIRQSDSIFVLNYSKNRIKNYIGGNVFLEIGFAYVLGKKIFLLSDIPNINYSDKIKSMKPIIINNDFKKIK